MRRMAMIVLPGWSGPGGRGGAARIRRRRQGVHARSHQPSPCATATLPMWE